MPLIVFKRMFTRVPGLSGWGRIGLGCSLLFVFVVNEVDLVFREGCCFFRRFAVVFCVRIKKAVLLSTFFPPLLLVFVVVVFVVDFYLLSWVVLGLVFPLSCPCLVSCFLGFFLAVCAMALGDAKG